MDVLSRGGIYVNVCNSDVFSVVNMYLDHLKFCVVWINGRRYVCCSECYVASDECDEPTPCLVRPIGAHGGEVMYFGSFCFRGELGFLNCDICMCAVNSFSSSSWFSIPFILIDLKCNKISLTFTGGSMCLCVVCCV